MISIRKLLPILIVAPILAAVGITGWLAFRSGKQSVEMLVIDLNQQVSSAIESRIETYVNLPNVLNKSALSAVKGNTLNPENFEQLKGYLWHQILWDELVLAFYYGNETGELLDIGRKDDGNYRLKIREQDSGLDMKTYRLNPQGSRLDEIPTVDYDPRDRPWYQAAKTVGDMTWSPIYFFAPPENVLGITATAPVYDPEGRLQGVFGVDVSLDHLSQFLNNLNISAKGTAFIMEPSGELVATSIKEPLLLNAENQASTGSQEEDYRYRLLASRSRHPAIQEAARQLPRELANLETLEGRETFDFFLDGNRHMAAVNRLQTDNGLDWLIVVVIPESDFMGYIDESFQHTILLGVAILGLMTLLGWAIAIWLTRPISRLSTVAEAIESGEFDPNSLERITNRSDEVGQLAQTFAMMAQTIYGREQGLKAKLSERRSEKDQFQRVMLSKQRQTYDDVQQLLKRSQASRRDSFNSNSTLNNQDII